MEFLLDSLNYLYTILALTLAYISSFFFVQQFITWSMEADHGKYKV